MCLKNILSLKTCSYVKEMSESKVIFSPLSQLIKQNIAFEWIRSQKRLNRLEVFVTPFESQSEPIPYKQINSLKTILEDYDSTYKHWIEGSSDPFAIIQRIICLRDSHKMNTFWNSSKFDCLSFALFCPKHESLNWFQKLQANHNQWFRNFSKSPLKSKFTTEFKDKAQKWIINYTTESSSYPLETIEYCSDSIAIKNSDTNDYEIIACNIDLDNSMSAFLCDAFTQKEYSDGNIAKVMKFNSSIAPFKIAFTFAENTEISADLIDLANYLIHSLKEFDISVFPFVPNHSISLYKCDELGIPYNVILNNESLETGVINLRNRDADTEESIHVSRFQQTICVYLELIHPTKIAIKKEN